MCNHPPTPELLCDLPRVGYRLGLIYLYRRVAFIVTPDSSAAVASKFIALCLQVSEFTNSASAIHQNVLLTICFH